MSNFNENLHCMICKEVTKHSCIDDTPTRHLYTVVCDTCGRFYAQGVTYGLLIKMIEEDEQWR